MQHFLARGVLLVGTAVLSAVATVALMPSVRPPAAGAQAIQPAGEVRASAFVLTGADGRARATLTLTDGAVNLRFFDGDGNLRTQVGDGGVAGFTGMNLSFALTAGAGGPGLTLWEGDGAKRVGLSPSGLALFDSAGTPRLRAGETLGTGDKAADGYSVELRGVDGSLLARLP